MLPISCSVPSRMMRGNWGLGWADETEAPPREARVGPPHADKSWRAIGQFHSEPHRCLIPAQAPNTPPRPHTRKLDPAASGLNMYIMSPTLHEILLCIPRALIPKLAHLLKECIRSISIKTTVPPTVLLCPLHQPDFLRPAITQRVCERLRGSQRKSRLSHGTIRWRKSKSN
jgi:hypothetical protein